MEEDTTNNSTGQTGQAVQEGPSSSNTIVSLHGSPRNTSRRKERSAKLVSLSQIYDFKPGDNVPSGSESSSRSNSIELSGNGVDDRALPWEKPFEGLHEELSLHAGESYRGDILRGNKQNNIFSLNQEKIALHRSTGSGGQGEFYDQISDLLDDEQADQEDISGLDLESLESHERSWHHKVGSAGSMKESFFHAVHGLKVGFASQRNMRIHCVLALLAVTTALVVQVEPWGLALIVIVCGFVMFAEMVNTAIEHMVDIRADFKYHISARYAKDTAAAAVLIAAIIAVITGAIVILPRVWHLLIG